MADLPDVLEEVRQERAYQDERWGTDTDDRLNTPTAFVAYIAHYATKWFRGTFPPHDRDTLVAFRAAMLKVAALGVAAVQWSDRLLDGSNQRPDVLG